MKTEVKSYKTKASARRACKKLGFDAETVFEDKDGMWKFPILVEDEVETPEAEVETEEEPAEGSEEVETEEVEGEIEKYIRRHSEIDSPCKRVWAIADSMPEAARKDVLAVCEQEGIAYYTARTQYQSWRRASIAQVVEDEKEAEKETEVDSEELEPEVEIEAEAGAEEE